MPGAKLNLSAKTEPALAPRSRLIIDSVFPNIDSGRFAAKCTQYNPFTVETVLLCDGHDKVKADLLYKYEGDRDWTRCPLRPAGNDVYRAEFECTKLGRYIYTIEASLDRYESWREGFFKKLAAGEATRVDAEAGMEILAANGTQAKAMIALRGFLDGHKTLTSADQPALEQILSDHGVRDAMRADWRDDSLARYPLELAVTVDPPYAGFSAWYEFFPRSRWSGIAEQGTLRDAAERLPYIANMGFNVAYLPPIHPIGQAFRKGRNNALSAEKDDVGSPWAIGGKEGGHKAIHPDLGDFKDFAALVEKAKTLGLQIALDIAFQCSPDHPYVKEHPQWFKHRSDGTIQYAENPPKKYQDIYPFDFESSDWKALWEELKSVILFWVDKGVKIFRVDNPHTKAFPFWEWAIGEIRAAHPDVIFLAEAFTRPHIMAYLAKIGFNQSYTYFSWRHTKAELTDYMRDLTETALKDYFRPNFWPNTPDILTEALQHGGRGMHVQRLILAATLSSNYGIYGPAFELMDSVPHVHGREDYLNSEKYEARTWDVNALQSLAPLITRVNRIRRENRALHSNRGLMFHPTSNDNLIAYTKDDGSNLILTVVNLDPYNRQSGIVDLQIQHLGIKRDGTYPVHDLLSHARYQWQGWKNYVELDPHIIPAHIFRIERD